MVQLLWLSSLSRYSQPLTSYCTMSVYEIACFVTYNIKFFNKWYNSLNTFQINEDFWKVMQKTSLVLLFWYQIKFNISTSETVTEILSTKLYCHFKWSYQCNHKTEKISFHEHFNMKNVMFGWGVFFKRQLG